MSLTLPLISTIAFGYKLILYSSEGDTSNMISSSSSSLLILVLNEINKESIFLIFIKESTILYIGILYDSLNDSLRCKIFEVFEEILSESIKVSLFLSNLTVVSLIVSFSIKLKFKESKLFLESHKFNVSVSFSFKKV